MARSSVVRVPTGDRDLRRGATPTDRARAVGAPLPEGTRPRLSRERIVRTAASLADEVGLDRLTMRELARALDAGTMSLYHHVADKRALMEALAELVWNEIEIPDPAQPWEVRIRSIAWALRRAARRHPRLVPLLITRRYTVGRGLEPVEVLLRACRDAGFDAAGSVMCVRTLVSLVVGSAEGEASRPIAGEAALADGAAGLATRFPLLVEALEAAHRVDPDDEFAFGLDVVLAGLAGHRQRREGEGGEGRT